VAGSGSVSGAADPWQKYTYRCLSRLCAQAPAPATLITMNESNETKVLRTTVEVDGERRLGKREST
jgi:protein subunit release factor B